MKQSKLIQDLENYTEREQLVAIELITSKQPNLEELCVSSASTMDKQRVPPLLTVIYEMRSLILQVSSEDSHQVQHYLSSRLEYLYKKVSPEKMAEITGENLVSFLSQTNDYLFEKVGDSLTALATLSTTAQETVNHAIEARTDSRINQSICEQAINTTIDSFFKAAVSGVMSGSLDKTIEESANRVILGGVGLGVSSELGTQIDSKRKKSLVKAGVKTLGKTESLLGTSVAAVGGAAIASLPKYTADVAMHGVIGGVSGYVKTGTVTGAMTSAVKGAISRGIYSYGWELLDGKTSLNHRCLLKAGVARIASKMTADAVVNNYPITGAAAVAGAVILENISNYISNSKNPYVLSAVETIQNSLPYLRDTARSIWNAVDEFSMEIYGVDPEELKINKGKESETSALQTKDPDSMQVKSFQVITEVESKSRASSFDSFISDEGLEQIKHSFSRQNSSSPKTVTANISPPTSPKRIDGKTGSKFRFS